MIQDFATWGTLAGSIATALATIFLWRVTNVLAIETRRMANAAAQPQIVATLVPNAWSTLHMDIGVENTGNATAFSIQVEFDPPLENTEVRRERIIPFREISVLKPGQAINSYLSEIADYLDKNFMVKISWALHPDSVDRQSLSYSLNMSDYDGVSYLGARDPLVQVAEEIKHIREDWRGVARGNQRIKIDSFSGRDRNSEAQAIRERMEGRRRQSAKDSEV